ncbi:L,D-transpeptidase family protein [Mesobacterium pallidum]|uniref:L,D-transpeptidase family protein n=1 Tax=Mesobacterium pallidum TaxID=2872037 RepID=UPI003AB9459A
MLPLSRRISALALGAAVASTLALGAAPAMAQGVTAFKQAVAEAAAQDKGIAAYYQAANYDDLWTGNDDGARRRALLEAVADAGAHGLPAGRYDPAAIEALLASPKTARDRGRVEVEMSKLFLQYARDIQTGVLEPKRIDSGIVRAIPYRDRASLLAAVGKSTPKAFFRALPPKTGEYARLMKEKMRLEKLLAQGGWGQSVPGSKLEPGAQGAGVVALRNRLVAMGYMAPSASQSYDAAMQQAVQQFQVDHGLSPDGVAGSGTLAEINVPVERRLQSILVAMERERWTNIPRGDRHVLVNLTDFSAKIVDFDKVTFETRSVIGADSSDRRSPEFSDVMEHMVINPTWNVPRSIAVKEYLPMMKRNPNAAGHLNLYDARGRQVSRSSINFNAYTERTFPYNIKQPPSDGNALGLVKFMFPNKYNIYLHDTPSKSLFERETRAFSHGCIRLQQPFDFAYALLAVQTDDPKGLFHSKLNTGRETVVPLDQPIPVHLIYRTAFTQAKGNTNYRRDVYGRDAKIWNALSAAGVTLRAVQG